jgi:hypothetical protein
LQFDGGFLGLRDPANTLHLTSRMATAQFSIREHTLPASYVREYARSTADDQEVELKLAIKQYTPLKSAPPNGQGVTVIGAHANGFPKVCNATPAIPAPG